MSKRDIIVIGASAGGLEAASAVVAALPANLPAAVFLVIHTSPLTPSIAPDILNRARGLRAEHARDGQPIEPGRIYVAPSDHHLLLASGRMHVAHGPRENGFRPAIDPLFRSAARVLGARVIGVVLSGMLDDGSQGLRLIKENGGVAIAQDPEEALCPSMPAAAIRVARVDHVLKTAEIARTLKRLVRQRVPAKGANMKRAKKRAADIVESGGAIEEPPVNGPPGIFSCPECGGSLWELGDGRQLRFRCYLGHGYTADGLAVQQHERLEDALWSAVRALQEHAALRRRMADRVHDSRWPRFAEEYRREAADADTRAEQIRDLLVERSAPAGPPTDNGGRAKSRGKAR